MKSLLMFTLLLLAPLFLFSQASVTGSWKIEVPDGEGGMIPAKLIFDESGNYSLDVGMDGTANVRGKYELAGNRITLWDVDGEFACPSEVKGVYDFEVSDTALTATAVSDDCPGRKGSGKVNMTRM